MLVLLKVLGLAVIFLGAMREVRTKSWSYIGKSLLIVVAFVLYSALGFWILFADKLGVPQSSASAAIMTFGFLAWLLAGVVGMVIASPKN